MEEVVDREGMVTEAMAAMDGDGDGDTIESSASQSGSWPPSHAGRGREASGFPGQTAVCR